MSAPTPEDRRPLRCDWCGEIYPHDQTGRCLISRRTADAGIAFCNGPLVPHDRRHDAATLAAEREAVGKLVEATLKDIRSTLRAVMRGESVIAAISLSGAIDEIDAALSALERREEKPK